MPILYVAGVTLGENPKNLPPETLAAIVRCSLAIGEERRSLLRILSGAGCPDKEYILLNEHSADADRRDALNAVKNHAETVFFSDAGTPCISDPDYTFIALCRDSGVTIRSLPGPCSVTTAISVSGIAAEKFFFAGFPPKSGTERASFFKKIMTAPETTIFMERPYALEATLKDMLTFKRKISISMNLGMPTESVYYDLPVKLLEKLAGVKAPFVVVVPPEKPVGGKRKVI